MLHLVLDMRRDARDDDQIRRTVTVDLVGDVKAVDRVCVVRWGLRRRDHPQKGTARPELMREVELLDNRMECPLAELSGDRG